MPFSPQELHAKHKENTIPTEGWIRVIDNHMISVLPFWEGKEFVIPVSKAIPQTVLDELQKVYDKYDWKLAIEPKMEMDMHGEEYVKSYNLVCYPCH